MDFNFMILFAKYFPLSSTFSLNQTPTFISKSTFRAKLNWIDSLTERQELKINLCVHDMCTWMYVWAYFQARLHSSENKSRHDSREGLVAKESLLHPLPWQIASSLKAIALFSPKSRNFCYNASFAFMA